MLETLFNPGGRIGPLPFRNAALILIAIGAALSLVPLVWPSLFLSVISMVLLYPWVVIWGKRFHDAGKSGWWFLAVFVPWMAINSGASYLIGQQFGAAIVPGTPPAEVFAQAAARMQSIAVPGAIVSTVVALAFALIINEELKSDPETNAYGPPTKRT